METKVQIHTRISFTTDFFFPWSLLKCALSSTLSQFLPTPCTASFKSKAVIATVAEPEPGKEQREKQGLITFQTSFFRREIMMLLYTGKYETLLLQNIRKAAATTIPIIKNISNTDMLYLSVASQGSIVFATSWTNSKIQTLGIFMAGSNWKWD